MLHRMTQEYVRLFNKKDIESISLLFHEDIVLEDPSNKFLGIQSVLSEIKNLFSNKDLFLKTKHIVSDEVNNTSVLEFEIQVGGKSLAGVDVITWVTSGDHLQIASLTAYVNEINADKPVHT